jgi:hypothetical protein
VALVEGLVDIDILCERAALLPIAAEWSRSICERLQALADASTGQ